MSISSTTSSAEPVAPAAIAAAAAAKSRQLAERLQPTPLVRSAFFSQRTGAEVWLKQENLQPTGSFKVRGAFSRLLDLDAGQRRAGAVAASSGNHGAAVAHVLDVLGVPGVIFVPEHTSRAKVDAIRAVGGDVRFHGHDGLDTELHAREYATRHGMTYVSPYNDAAVIAGQGTCGVEIARELPGVEAVFVAVGGGGLAAGIGSVLRQLEHPVQIVGCQPQNSPVMSVSIEAGHIVEMPSEPTLSDGTAGGIEAGAITFDLCREVVDEFVVVDEDAIATAMRTCMEAEGQVIEGAAGVALAGLLARARAFAGRKVVVVICGGNVSTSTLDAIRRST